MILANIFWEAFMKSLIVKRSVDIDGHKTSVSLEDAFWSDLKKIAHMQRATLSKVLTEIDNGRRQGNLSSAIRVFVFDQVRAHGDLWRYSRSRRSEEETAQINVLPVQPKG
jgi:predicted DNA-binding ribbon-helix-helix protein